MLSQAGVPEQSWERCIRHNERIKDNCVRLAVLINNNTGKGHRLRRRLSSTTNATNIGRFIHRSNILVLST